MEHKIIPWILGLLISLLIGHYVTKKILNLLRSHVGCDDEAMTRFLASHALNRNNSTNETHSDDPDVLELNQVPPGLQGVLERFFFTIIIAFNVSGAAVAMMGWLAVKMVTNLNRGDLPSRPIVRARALTGLIGGLVSLTFALIGGLICWLKIP